MNKTLILVICLLVMSGCVPPQDPEWGLKGDQYYVRSNHGILSMYRTSDRTTLDESPIVERISGYMEVDEVYYISGNYHIDDEVIKNSRVVYDSETGHISWYESNAIPDDISRLFLRKDEDCGLDAVNCYVSKKVAPDGTDILAGS